MSHKYSKLPENSSLILTDLESALRENHFDKHNYYKIVWAKNNDISLGVDDYRINIQKNDVFFCTPLNKLELGDTISGAVVYIFNREFYCIRDHDNEVSCNGFLFLGSSVPIIISLDEKDQMSFELMYRIFVEEFKNKDHIQGEMLLVLLKRLLIKSVRIARRTLPHEDMPQSKLDIIRKFNLLVEMHFKEKHKVSEYANLLNKSPKTLSNLFSKFNNRTPLQVINDRIVLEAKKLLLFSEKSSKEIAFGLGFSEASHFSKFLKNQVGSSPLHFKNSTLNIY